MLDVIIIGAGVIGASVARELSRYKLDILVLEKELDVCEGTSKANSAIVHSGYDPKPGTLKAKLNVEGNKLFDNLSKDLGFEFGRNGSITVCNSEEDLPKLKELQEIGFQNGVATKILNREETLKLEPNVSDNVKYCLFAPTCGIVNPFEYTIALMENAIDNNVKLKLNEEVISIKNEGSFYKVNTKNNSYDSKIVINAAGVNSSKIANMIGCFEFEIKPRKGEYFVLNNFKEPFISRPIFPLPTDKGKGILVTPTTHRNYLLGPTSEFVLDPDDLSTDKLTLDRVKMEVVKSVKNIPFNEIIRSFSGLRAYPTGGDFIIKEDTINKNFYHLAGIQSPGLASSYAIALYLVDIIKKTNTLLLKDDFNPKRRPFIKLNRLKSDERNALIKKDPRFGRIVCRCEKITEGEIVDCINRSVPCLTINAVKKRIRPGFGKCQGGFCQSEVLKILARENNLDESEIMLGKLDSIILKQQTKEGDK